PNYNWQPLPYADTFEYNWANTEDVIVLKTDRGELDYTISGIPTAQFRSVLDDPKYKDQLVTFDSPSQQWLGFNHEKAPFDNLKVRQAIATAIDTEKQVRLQRGAGKRLYGVFPSTSSAFDPTFKGIPFDPGKAKSLLAEAGQSSLAFELAFGDSAA